MVFNALKKVLFKKIPTPLPPKILDDNKTKYQKTIKAVSGKWYTENMNSKLPPINRRRLIKKEKIKEEKTKEIFHRTNYHWNYWNLQLHLNKLEWVDQNTLCHKDN